MLSSHFRLFMLLVLYSASGHVCLMCSTDSAMSPADTAYTAQMQHLAMSAASGIVKHFACFNQDGSQSFEAAECIRIYQH